MTHIALQLADSGVLRQCHMVAECLPCQLQGQQRGSTRDAVVHKHAGLVQVTLDPDLYTPATHSNRSGQGASWGFQRCILIALLDTHGTWHWLVVCTPCGSVSVLFQSKQIV